MSGENKSEINLLINQARSGAENAFDALLRKYSPLVTSLVAKYSVGFTKEDAEDMRQEALVILYNAVMKYNTEQDGVDFGLYAKICIERGLVSQLRTLSRRPVIEQIPENESLPGPDDVSRGVIESESIREIWRLINENLSDYENKVWNLHLSGQSPAKTAGMLGRDVKSIDNALCRIRAKLRKALKRQYP